MTLLPVELSGALLVGLGAVLAGIGSVLSGMGALRSARREKCANDKTE